jgi:hypothetical protein
MEHAMTLTPDVQDVPGIAHQLLLLSSPDLLGKGLLVRNILRQHSISLPSIYNSQLEIIMFRAGSNNDDAKARKQMAYKSYDHAAASGSGRNCIAGH